MFKMMNKRFSKIISLLLVIVLVFPNLTINAKDNVTTTDESIVANIIKEKDTSVVVEKQADKFVINVEMDFHIDEKNGVRLGN